jgi:hypothetical protein
MSFGHFLHQLPMILKVLKKIWNAFSALIGHEILQKEYQEIKKDNPTFCDSKSKFFFIAFKKVNSCFDQIFKECSDICILYF